MGFYGTRLDEMWVAAVCGVEWISLDMWGCAGLGWAGGNGPAVCRYERIESM